MPAEPPVAGGGSRRSTSTVTPVSEPPPLLRFNHRRRPGSACWPQYFCLTVDRSGGLMARGGSHTGSHRIGRASRRRDRRRLHRRGPRPRPAAGRRPPGGGGGVVARHHRRGRGRLRRRARVRPRGAGDLPRRRRRPHLHPQPPARPARRRPRSRRGSTWCARSRWPPTPRRRRALVAAADRAGTVATVPVRLPLLPDGPRGAGPGRQRPARSCAWRTAATCRTGCRPTGTTTGASMPSCPARPGPSPTSARTGATCVEFVTGDRLASVCAELVTAVPEREHTDAHVPAFATAGPGRQRAGRGGRSPPRTWPWCCSAPSTGVSGSVVVSQISAGHKNQLRLEVVTDGATLAFDQEHPDTLWVGRRGPSEIVERDPNQLDPTAAPYANVPPGHPQGYQDCFDAFVADTLRAIETGDSAEVDGLPTFADGARAVRITDAVLRSSRDGGWVDVTRALAERGGRTMKLGFLTACLPKRSLEDICAWAAAEGFEALEVAAWPDLGDRPFVATHLNADGFGEKEADEARALFDRHGLELSSLAYYDNNLDPDPAERAAHHEHLHRCIDAAARLGCPTVGTFVGRDPGRSVADNLRDAEAVFAPLVDHAGEAGVKLIIENCVMEGWHPDGYPGNLAYSPELWEWMFSIGLYLNYDPSHLLWMGIDPVEAVRPYVDRIPHAQAKDIELDPAARNRFGWPGRAVQRDDPWDVGWWRYRVPGPRPGRLEPPRRRPLRGRLRRRAVRRARGPDVGWHRGEGRDRPADRPRHPPTPAGGVMATPALLEVRGLTKEYPGVRALAGVDFEVRPRRGALHRRPQRRRQVDPDQVHLGGRRPDRRRDPARRRAAHHREPVGGDRPRRRPRSTRSSTWSPTSVWSTTSSSATSCKRRGFLDRARMRRETTELLRRVGHESIAPNTRVSDLRPGRAADRVDRPVAVPRGPPPHHGRAVGHPRRQRDRDALRGGAAAHRRGRRRRLHLAPARRDPPHRRPGHGAAGGATVVSGLPAEHAGRRARHPHGRHRLRAAVPRAAHPAAAASCSRCATCSASPT